MFCITIHTPRPLQDKINHSNNLFQNNWYVFYLGDISYNVSQFNPTVLQNILNLVNKKCSWPLCINLFFIRPNQKSKRDRDADIQIDRDREIVALSIHWIVYFLLELYIFIILYLLIISLFFSLYIFAVLACIQLPVINSKTIVN